MSRRCWTAEDCLNQLRSSGVRLSLSAPGKVKVEAPTDLDLAPIVRMVRRHKLGLIRLLQRAQQTPGLRRSKPVRLPESLPLSTSKLVRMVDETFADVAAVEVIGIFPEKSNAAKT